MADAESIDMSTLPSPPPPGSPPHVVLAYACRLQIEGAREQLARDGEVRPSTWDAIFRLLDLSIEACPPDDDRRYRRG